MIKVGIVGAGPWTSMVHAPVFATGPETALSGVWARRPEAAAKLGVERGLQLQRLSDAAARQLSSTR